MVRFCSHRMSPRKPHVARRFFVTVEREHNINYSAVLAGRWWKNGVMKTQNGVRCAMYIPLISKPEYANWQRAK